MMFLFFLTLLASPSPPPPPTAQNWLGVTLQYSTPSRDLAYSISTVRLFSGSPLPITIPFIADMPIRTTLKNVHLYSGRVYLNWSIEEEIDFDNPFDLVVYAVVDDKEIQVHRANYKIDRRKLPYSLRRFVKVKYALENNEKAETVIAERVALLAAPSK